MTLKEIVKKLNESLKNLTPGETFNIIELASAKLDAEIKKEEEKALSDENYYKELKEKLGE